MTNLDTILVYRLRQADETLQEICRMPDEGYSPRTIINRCYYAMFYIVLALFIARHIPHKTSKHSGVIGIFNKEFIHTGLIDARYGKMLYQLFDARLECDYVDFSAPTLEEARKAVEKAHAFVIAVKSLIQTP